MATIHWDEDIEKIMIGTTDEDMDEDMDEFIKEYGLKILDKSFYHGLKNVTTKSKYFTQCTIIAHAKFGKNEENFIFVKAFAICSSQENFNKKIGREISEGRAIKGLNLIFDFLAEKSGNLENKNKFLNFFKKQRVRKGGKKHLNITYFPYESKFSYYIYDLDDFKEVHGFLYKKHFPERKENECC